MRHRSARLGDGLTAAGLTNGCLLVHRRPRLLLPSSGNLKDASAEVFQRVGSGIAAPAQTVGGRTALAENPAEARILFKRFHFRQQRRSR
jgi:hypothetical protein